MPKRTDIKKILVIGSGPIIIGQAAEFDYAGTQACLALEEEGYEVVLVNSNPATIMTDKSIASKVYIEPLTLEFVSKIIRIEKPDAILGSLGGQTGLNLVVELANSGILKQEKIEILGTKLDAIQQAEDRDLFKKLMDELNQPIPESKIVNNVEDAIDFVKEIGYPIVVRPAYTLGGTGGGFASNHEQLIEITTNGLKLSPVNQCLIEKSIAGFKEIEYEVMRDDNDNAIVVCNMENVDPVGIHTGDSIVIAPSLTLSDREHQMLRNASLEIIRALKICGGCNVQLALDPDSFKYYVIEVNPRVSRSSALASKATGYPIAKIAAKLAVGYTLDEIINPITNTSYACFEPSLDYIVSKLPRFYFDKFDHANSTLGTQMKATGEVMALGRNFEESILKAIRSLELKVDHIHLVEFDTYTTKELYEKIKLRDDKRLYAIMELIRREESFEKIHEITMIDYFFLSKLRNIKNLENKLKSNVMDVEVLKEVKKNGFSDTYIARVWNVLESDVSTLRYQNNIRPVYKMVDTCAGEFESKTPYFYSTYANENESIRSDKKKVIVLGSGPIRIGQGVEFDYATVHCVQTLRELGYEAIIVNNNPETVSTDFSISDKLYFEPLTVEDVMHIVDLENPLGVIVQFGGQTAINLTSELVKRDVKILGTSLENINLAENRDEFEKMLNSLEIKQPLGKTAYDIETACKIADEIKYPVLVRPSYVLGGRAMEIVYNKQDLEVYMKNAMKEISHDSPILVDKYIIGKEAEIDAICDGENVFIPGIMEHIERAGIHSGDSISVYPSVSLSEKVKQQIIDYTIKIGVNFNFIGLFNIQFIIDENEDVYVLEVNPRSSRSMPFLSKITNVLMAKEATKVIMGDNLKDLGYTSNINEEPKRIYVKAPVFSFAKLRNVDTTLGPEMKSTGEALGSDVTLEKALYKALVAANVKVPLNGNVLMTIADEDKELYLGIAKKFESLGFKILATKGTSKFLNDHNVSNTYISKIDNENSIIDLIVNGEIDYVINTMSKEKDCQNDGFLIRRVAAENGISSFSTYDTIKAILNVIEAHSFSIKNL